MFDFSNMGLLQDAEKDIKIIDRSSGKRDEKSGVWIPPGQPIEIEARAPILPLANEDLNFGEGGTYTRQDRKMYWHGEPLAKGQKVEVDGEGAFTVGEGKDYSHVASGLRVYILAREGVAGV